MTSGLGFGCALVPAPALIRRGVLNPSVISDDSDRPSHDDLKEIPCSKCKFCIRIQSPVGSGHFKLMYDVYLDAVQASATMPQLHCKTILPLAFKQFLVIALPKHDIKFSCNFCNYNPHLVKSQPLPNTAMHTIAKSHEFLPAEVVQ